MSSEENTKIHTIAFYNIENLFDTFDNEYTKDDDFLPTSAKRWTIKRYENKLFKIGRVISEIGNTNGGKLPAIVGLAEVENKDVILDLIHSDHLKTNNYAIVHYDSSDERGVDVALIYDQTVFKVTDSETFSIYFEDEFGERDYTRDILLVSGNFEGELIHIIVNHWSSRREGEKETEYKRLKASDKVNQIITHLNSKYTNAKVIVMGDFNDNPNDKSIKSMEAISRLYNPFKTLLSRDKGSLNHNFQWHLFDQILFSTNFFDTTTSHIAFHKADIFDDISLTQYHGKYKGQPFRTYVGKKYKGGYSDHFPVFIQLKEDD